jgi:hypothetical protein
MSEIVFENGKAITVEIESEPIHLTVNNNFNLEVKNAWNVDVKTEPIVVNVMGGKGDAGLSAYQTWLSLCNTGTEQDFIDSLKAVRPYKVYTALLTQIGTDAPVATVLENTIGDIIWSYIDVGQYRATLTGAFPIDKFFAPFYIADTDVNVAGGGERVMLYRLNDNAFDIVAVSNGNLNYTGIEIRVYD